MPFTERAYYPPAAAGGAGPGTAPFPAFQFRGRHESPDWRRLSAVDVGRVWREGDVAVLQEHLEHVTFCSAEQERCPHCQGPADPLLLKLLRLAQLCTEYLLHSQEYLSAQLCGLEEALREAQAQRDQLGKEVAQHLQEIKELKEECRRRKRMIGTQQLMLEAQAQAIYHQCQFCEKAFVNYSFLQSHMQRRHPEESRIEQKRKAETDKLQDEFDKLKEQLQLVKSQLEAEQQANMARFYKKCEQQKSKEEEILQSFHKWKEEEKEKWADEVGKVKEMFMKELKELSSRNSTLESKLLELQKSNMQQKSNLGTLKDSEEFTEEKPQSPQDSGQSVVKLLEKQEKQAPVMHVLEPIEEVSEEEKEIEKGHHKTGSSNQHLINALKTDPSITKDLRVVFEQALEEKLESMGIKGVRGIPKHRLNKILRAIESARECKQKQEPDIQRIREHLERQVSFRVEEKSSSCNRPVSCPQLPSEDKQTFSQLGISSSTRPRKPVKRSSTAVRPAEQRTAIDENTSTPKSRKLFGNGVSRKTSSITTPPFSSEEEPDEDDTKQSSTPPELLQKQSETSGSQVSASQKASGKSDVDGMEENKVETGTPAKTSEGTVIQKLTEQVGKSLSNHGNGNKPAGGIDVAQAFIKKEEVQELKLTDVDDDDWDISSIEEEFFLTKDGRGQKASAVQKNESNAASVVQTRGLPKRSAPKEEGLHEADNTNTLKSSLVTITDWSDSSDI